MSVSSWEFKSPPGHKWALGAVGLARRAYIAKVGGSNPSVPTFAAVAHVVERKAENFEVASASLARGTKRGCSIVVIMQPCQG